LRNAIAEISWIYSQSSKHFIPSHPLHDLYLSICGRDICTRQELVSAGGRSRSKPAIDDFTQALINAHFEGQEVHVAAEHSTIYMKCPKM